MEDYGLKVSEPEVDVRDAEDKDLSLKSGLTLLKVYDQDQLVLTGSGWDDVSHSLGYIPQYLGFVKSTDGLVYLGVGVFSNAFEVPVSITKINSSTLSFYNSGGLTAFYYIFYEPAEIGVAPTVLKTNSFGIIISKDGVGVSEANILEQTFNSEKNSLKIISDDVSTNTVNGTTNLNIEHDLGFSPGFLVFYEVDNSGTWFFTETSEDISGKSVLVRTSSDETHVHITITTGASASVKVHYYILADPGEEI